MSVLDPSIIGELVAPAVMIPACGLLCLSTNARMMSVIGRLRSLHTERVALFVDDPGENPRRKIAREIRFEGVAVQSTHMLHRLNCMRITLMVLFCAIVFLLLCSAGIGLARVVEWCGAFAVLCFIFAGLLMATAMIISLYEVGVGLRALRFEHERMCALDAADRNLTTTQPTTNAEGNQQA